MLATMGRDEVLARRMITQHVAGGPAASPADVVARLTCVQSQEHAHALWSLGLRSDTDDATLRAAFDRGDFLRTHLLRPTWHFVLPADIGWILALTAPRVHQRNAKVYRDQGVPEAIGQGAFTIIEQRLRDGGPATRAQLGEALAERGIAATGTRLAHVVMHAELDGLVASGPMAGAQHTYALLSGTAPTGTQPDDPEAELAFRFFVGHGPASDEDFVRWSGLTKGVTRAALHRLGDRLAVVECEGTDHWYDPTRTYDPGTDVDGAAPLLPLYDELTLSYPKISFPTAVGHPYPPGVDRFAGTVVVDRVDVGSWKRTLTGDRVEVETTLAPGTSQGHRALVERAGDRLRNFLGRDGRG